MGKFTENTPVLDEYHVPCGIETWQWEIPHKNRDSLMGKLSIDGIYLFVHCHDWLPEGKPLKKNVKFAEEICETV